MYLLRFEWDALTQIIVPWVFSQTVILRTHLFILGTKFMPLQAFPRAIKKIEKLCFKQSLILPLAKVNFDSLKDYKVLTHFVRIFKIDSNENLKSQ